MAENRRTERKLGELPCVPPEGHEHMGDDYCATHGMSPMTVLGVCETVFFSNARPWNGAKDVQLGDEAIVIFGGGWGRVTATLPDSVEITYRDGARWFKRNIVRRLKPREGESQK